MKKLVLFALAAISASYANAQCSEIFISEYAEGNYNNKVIELYNPSLGDIDLSAYRLIRWSNGSTTSDSDNRYVLPLTGTIIPGGTYLICIDRRDAGATGLDTTVFTELMNIVDASNHGYYSPDYNDGSDGSRVLSFNGDDAFSLERSNGAGYDIVDIFGLIGEQPQTSTGGTGAGWTDEPNYWDGVGAYWTRDQTLVRKPSVQGGVTANPGLAYSIPGGFNPALEYDSLPKNNWDSLGVHTCSCPCYINVDTMNVVDASCEGNDGTFGVLASGGTPPYNYHWSNGGLTTEDEQIGLDGGVYAVTVQDYNGCFGIAVVNISAPAGFSAAFNTTDETCGEGNATATVTISGGTSPFTYEWDDNLSQTSAQASNLSGGSYVVNITDGFDCTSSYQVNVLGDPEVALETAITAPSNCGASDGSAFVNVTSGGGSYAYAWSSGGSSFMELNLGAGTYQVVVVDGNGCSDSAAVVVSDPGAPSIVINASSDASCFGGNDGSANITALGGTTPYIYTWSNGDNTSVATGLSAGEATILVEDGSGCTSGVVVEIGSPDEVSGLAVSTNSSANNDGTASVSATGGTAPYTYLWDDSAAQTGATASNLASDSVTVVITDANGCTGSAWVFVDYTSGISDLMSTMEVMIYPNPSRNGIFNVVVNEKVKEIRFLNSLGAVVITVPTNNEQGTFELDASYLGAGVYFTQMVSGLGIINYQKVIIE